MSKTTKTNSEPEGSPQENQTPVELDFNDIEQRANSLQRIKETPTVTTPVKEETAQERLSTYVKKVIVEDFAKKNKSTTTLALIGITKLVQDGGTNTGKPKLSRTVDEYVFDLGDLRYFIHVHDKNGTVRKLVKTLRSPIAVIALENKRPGPLLKKLQRLNPTLVISSPDSIYCCEIQTDNYDQSMSARIREALQQREQKLRDDRNRTNNPKPPSKAKNKKKKNKTTNRITNVISD